jgi:glycosyltransferase involved in cell wall biosynthesis
MDPLVSILIPCYNGSLWVAQCIRSALDQTYHHKEIVVVDDGSTDDSLEIIRGFGSRIRVESGPNRGSNVARNRLMQLSQGNWLSFLDADDFLLPEKIQRQMALVLSNPSVDVVYSPTMEFIEKAGQMLHFPVEDDDLYANYIRWSPFSTIAPLWRKSAILDVGGWKADQPACQEHELLLRLMMAGKEFEFCRDALSVYRKAGSQTVSRRSPLKTLMLKMELTDRMEAHLIASGKLNAARSQALAQARFEAARTAYRWDRQYANEMMAKARRVPLSAIKHVDRRYRLALGAFGFEFAERLARMRRLMLKKRR